MRTYCFPARLLAFLLLHALGLDLKHSHYSTSNWSKAHSLELRKEWKPSWLMELKMEGHVMLLLCTLLLPIFVYQWDLLSFSLWGLTRCNLMFPDGKVADLLGPCSIPFPSFLLYFCSSYSFLLVTKENLYHLLTTLGVSFYAFSLPYFV